MTAEIPHGAIRDDTDRLNKPPDSVRNTGMALEEFRRDPSEENRAALLAAYLSIPEQRRRYVLGDMDIKDRPLTSAWDVTA